MLSQLHNRVLREQREGKDWNDTLFNTHKPTGTALDGRRKKNGGECAGTRALLAASQRQRAGKGDATHGAAEERGRGGKESESIGPGGLKRCRDPTGGRFGGDRRLRLPSSTAEKEGRLFGPKNCTPWAHKYLKKKKNRVVTE